MILCTSENDKRALYKRNMLIYLGLTIFCIVFFIVYDRFSHNVRSAYMTFLFLFPLILGFFPSLISLKFPALRKQGQWSRNLYHSGVAALTVSSLLRGIFEIAGTASDYQEWLMLIGGILLLCGIVLWIFRVVVR